MLVPEEMREITRSRLIKLKQKYCLIGANALGNIYSQKTLHNHVCIIFYKCTIANLSEKIVTCNIILFQKVSSQYGV